MHRCSGWNECPVHWNGRKLNCIWVEVISNLCRSVNKTVQDSFSLWPWGLLTYAAPLVGLNGNQQDSGADMKGSWCVVTFGGETEVMSHISRNLEAMVKQQSFWWYPEWTGVTSVKTWMQYFLVIFLAQVAGAKWRLGVGSPPHWQNVSNPMPWWDEAGESVLCTSLQFIV